MLLLIDHSASFDWFISGNFGRICRIYSYVIYIEQLLLHEGNAGSVRVI